MTKLNVANRRGTNSYKWDSCADPEVLPLWVADMDFKAAPCIINALRNRVEHGVFGYTKVPESYYQSTIDWFHSRHGWTMQRESIIYTIGVVPAISAIIQALTNPGDKVMTLTPAYNCFFSSIRNSQCQLAPCPLHSKEHADEYGDIDWEIDFTEFERITSDPQVKLFLLCNPHNPTGHVWTRSELEQMGEICLKHNVFIVADEIHNELIMPNHHYTPYASLGTEFEEHCAVCHSPSKSFNIAGLQIANISILDATIRQRVDKQININEVCDVNPFGIEALQAAYSPEGAEWLEALNAHIWSNYTYMLEHLRSHMPLLHTSRLQGTYLAWIDFSALPKDPDTIEEELLRDHKLWLNSGHMYDPLPTTFMRINLACTRETLTEALKRLQDYYDKQ